MSPQPPPTITHSDELLNLPTLDLSTLGLPILGCQHHPYMHHSDCVAFDCQCNSNSTTECKCTDKMRKCKLGYRYWCIECNYGLKGMYSKCTNEACSKYNKSMFD